MPIKLGKFCFETGSKKLELLERIHNADGSIPIPERIEEKLAGEMISRRDSGLIFRTETPYCFKRFHDMLFEVVPGRALDPFKEGMAIVPFDLKTIEKIIRLEEIGDLTIDGIIRGKREQVGLYCNQRGIDAGEVIRSLSYSISRLCEHKLTGSIFIHPNVRDTYIILTDNECAFRLNSAGQISLVGAREPSKGGQTLSKFGGVLAEVSDLYRRAFKNLFYSGRIAYEAKFGIEPIVFHEFRYFKMKDYKLGGIINEDSTKGLCFGSTPPDGEILTFMGNYTNDMIHSIKPARYVKYAYTISNALELWGYIPNISAVFTCGNLSSFSRGCGRAMLSEVPYVVFMSSEEFSSLKVGDSILLNIGKGSYSLKKIDKAH